MHNPLKFLRIREIRYPHFITNFNLFILISSWFVITSFGSPACAKDIEPFEFEIVQTNQSSSRLIPQSGWKSSSMPIKDFFEPQNENTVGRKALWARFHFEASIGDNQSLALLVGSSSERFDVYLNGSFVYKNYFEISDRNFANFEPHYIELAKLASGTNTIDIRLESDVFWTISLQNVKIGIEKKIKFEYEGILLTSFQGPKNVNIILIAATIFTIALWMMRRKEKILFWLSMVGLCWITRNTRYYLVHSVIDPEITWEFIANSTILLLLSFSAFGFHFFNVRKKNQFIAAAIFVALFIIGIRYILIIFGFSDLPSFLLTVPAFILIVFFFGLQTWRSPKVENISIFIALIISFFSSYHDLAFLAGAWEGVGFSLFPYAGLAVFSAFSFALGRRLLGALAVEENLKSILENRVIAATAELTASEHARRELEVASAITGERERMMREIHDGIGSNLVTALAVAERQQGNSATVSIIKSALTDLRIAVDSLEPIEGDIVTLLASLRYRMGPELGKAGINITWNVRPVPDIEWLDAINALHVLRILQQVIANILEHAQATEIEVSCKASRSDGQNGILVEMTDNGIGFEKAKPDRGHGLTNMAARADALHAKLMVSSISGKGTKVSLWLQQNYYQNVAG